MSTTPSVCPRCSKEFGCGIDTGACWCAEVQIAEGTRGAFAQYYEGCLCPECLGSVAAGRPEMPSVRAFLTSQLKGRNWLRR